MVESSENPSSEIVQAKTPAEPDPSSLHLTKFEAAFHQGPLPPPAVLREYNEVFPGLAAELILQSTTQLAHMQDMERKELEARIEEVRETRRQIGHGQKYGFAVAIVALSIAGYVAIHGSQATGSVIGGGTVVSLVGAFLYRQAHRNEGSSK